MRNLFLQERDRNYKAAILSSFMDSYGLSTMTQKVESHLVFIAATSFLYRVPVYVD
jgi:hypothetical protein